jgi:hypothetical protein
MANPVEARSVGLLLLLILFYALTAKLQSLIGAGSVGVLRILFLAVIPAMVGAMSVTGRFIDAINPVAVIGMILRIPLAYAALLITIGLLWFGPIVILRVASDSLPNLWHRESFLPWYLASEIGARGYFLGAISMMLCMYLWLAMFACIGGTIYERRKDLGVEPAVSPERTAARVSAETEWQRDKIMDRIFAELRGGALSNAGATVRKMIDESPHPLDECRWLYARALAMHPPLAEYLAQLALPRLIAVRATGEALKMLRERLAANPEFRPLTGLQLMQVAQLACDAGERPMARHLLSDFDRHYPNDNMASGAAKLAADLQR